MKVSIDGERCSGHGRCYVLAPRVFDTDDRGYGVVRSEGDLDDDLRAEGELAEQSCPEQAISVVD